MSHSHSGNGQDDAGGTGGIRRHRGLLLAVASVATEASARGFEAGAWWQGRRPVSRRTPVLDDLDPRRLGEVAPARLVADSALSGREALVDRDARPQVEADGRGQALTAGDHKDIRLP